MQAASTTQEAGGLREPRSHSRCLNRVAWKIQVHKIVLVVKAIAHKNSRAARPRQSETFHETASRCDVYLCSDSVRKEGPEHSSAHCTRRYRSMAFVRSIPMAKHSSR
jgi:hypothetical protein